MKRGRAGLFERRFKIAESGRFDFRVGDGGQRLRACLRSSRGSAGGGRRRCWRRQLGPQAVRAWSSLCRSCSVERSGNPLGVAYLAAPDRFGRRIPACPAVADVDRASIRRQPKSVGQQPGKHRCRWEPTDDSEVVDRLAAEGHQRRFKIQNQMSHGSTCPAATDGICRPGCEMVKV